MAKVPDPPPVSTLRAIGPATRVVPAGTVLWRVYFQGGAHPTTWEAFRAWGPAGSRFDPHRAPPSLQPDRAVLYTAVDGLTCLAEVFQDYRRLNRARGGPALAAFATTRPLVLLDLLGTWTTRIGASMALCTGPHARTRRWAQALFEAWPDLDGLQYGSSMNGHTPCQALWATAQSALPPHPSLNRRLDDPVLHTTLLDACARLGYALI